MDDKQKLDLLEKILSHSEECETVEFKKNYIGSEKLGIRISALSNAANLHEAKMSYIVFGIDDETHDVCGTNFKPLTEKVGNELLQIWLGKKLKPDIDIHFWEVEKDNLKVVIVEIPPTIDRPIKFNNEAYVRVGSGTPKLSDYPQKERKIWNNIQKNNFEKGVAMENVPASKVLEILDYAKFFSVTKQELPSNTNQFIERMIEFGLVRMVFDNSYDITNLGAILFANNLDMFPSVKRKAVRVMVYRGENKVNREKEQAFKGGYAIIFEPLLDYINDRLPQNDEITRSLRKSVKMYPEVAIREFVANSLIHQDLTLSGAGPLIEIYGSRIEIINTGEPLIDTQRFIDHPPRSRNEDLAAFMRLIGVCEEGGTGIDRALINMAIYQLPAPSFEKYENFTKVTMFAHKDLSDMSMDDKVRACFQHCVLKHVENQKMTNASIRERLGIQVSNYPAASAIIKVTLDRGLIKKFENRNEYVPYWV